MATPNWPAPVARAAAALLLTASLAGLGPRWLPLAGILLLVLLHPALLSVVSGAYRSHGYSLGLGSAIRRRWFETALVAIAVAGLGVRLAGVGVGLWHEVIDIDERRLAMSVLGFFRDGTLEHGTSEDHPGLHFWLLSAGGMGAYMWGLMSGFLRSIDDAPAELFLMAGRITNAVLATGIAVLTGLMGRALAGPAAGLLAAGLVVLSPLSMETSTQLRNDVGMAFFVMACAYAAVVWCDRPRRQSALLMGVLAGCAAGVKITAVFVLLPALFAAGMPWPGWRRVAPLGSVLGGFVAALAVTNHFIWSDFPNFIRQISMDYGHVQPGHFAYTAAPREAYTSLLAGYAVGWPILASAAAFTVARLASAHRRTYVFLAFPISYLCFMTLKTAIFTRWAYVLVPFVAIAGAGGLLEGYRLILRWSGEFAGGRRAALAGRTVALALCVAACLPILLPAVNGISRRFTPPTYAQAEAWLAANIPPGDRILSETGVLDLRAFDARAVRVADMRATLAAAPPSFHGCKWIVIPEYQFDIPALSNLFLMKSFVAKQGFGGNMGMDVRIYVTTPSAPRP